MTPAEPHDLRRWLSAGAQALKRARGRLDAINVFPVPDSDTGTNMYLTMQEGNRAVAKLPASASHREVVAAFARGALLGARGNSGVIVSQYLSAFLTRIDAEGGLTDAKPRGIAAALSDAASAAYAAVGQPVAGTILSVAEGAAKGANAAARARGARRADVVVGAVSAARASLRATTEQLPEAGAAGVVDAGAAGLLLQLEMLAEIVAGADALDGLDEVAWELAPTERGFAVVEARHPHAPGGAYEVMFVASDGGDAATRMGDLRQDLTALGDSVAVTGTHGLVQAHVHTDDPDSAVEVGIGVDARQILVNSLRLGAGHHDLEAPSEAQAAHAAASGGAAGVVALTSCPGLAAPLADAGAVVLVVPDPLKLKRRELRRAVRDAWGRGNGVVIAAGNVPLRNVAERIVQRKPTAGVTVLPAEHEAQVIAAVAAGAMATPGEPLAAVMREAVERCKTAATSVDAIDDDVDRLLTPDAEIITVILARGVPESVADSVRLSAAAVCPAADVVVYQGGHGEPGVLVGVETA